MALQKYLYGLVDNTIGKFMAVPMKRHPRFYKILDKEGDVVAKFVSKSYIENTYGWHSEKRDYVVLPYRIAKRSEEITSKMEEIMKRYVKEVKNIPK